MTFAGLPKDYFQFFRDLSDNNNRDWFEANRGRFRASVQDPLLDLVEAMVPHLKTVSPHFAAIAKRTGGSVFRIYRDTRFSKDKTPYKTNGGLHFRHALGKDAHAPGFYVHIAPDEVFFGGGIWMPPSPALLKIREAIRDKPKLWTKAAHTPEISSLGGLHGDSLTRPPKGFLADDPHIDDLKRKSFFVMQPGTEAQTLKSAFLDDLTVTFRTIKPLMKFLCDALGAPI